MRDVRDTYISQVVAGKSFADFGACGGRSMRRSRLPMRTARVG